ncbi:MAG: DUF11 domain-containing protein [Ilumatobacter sp.]|nr:DUF11 domain-containing protein [Ilumatobacter sp.]
MATDRPGFSKDFSPDPVDKGERSTLTFVIDNSANASDVSFLEFSDTLPTGMVIADPSNASTDCGEPSASVTFDAPAGGSTIALNVFGSFFAGARALVAGDTCTVVVDVVATAGGTPINSSSNLETTVGGVNRSAGKATASLDVLVAALHIAKEFTDDPIPPGGNATLEFTIENFDRTDPATGVAFADTLPGGVVVATPSTTTNDCGGPLTASAGSGTISLTGGTVAAGGFCTITVLVTAPSAGTYDNTSGTVSGMVGGVPVTGNEASDSLFVVPAPALTKEFTDDPAGAGGVVTVEFTITNTSPSDSASAISFSDEFPTVLPTSPSGAPADGSVCGAGSDFTFTPLFDPAPGTPTPATLTLTGASLAPAGMPGDSCTFSMTLDVDPSASTGTYPNVTSEITASVGMMSVTGDKATDDLVVVAPPSLTKEFTDDPITPGDSVTLEFRLEHDAFAPGDATSIGFADDLTFVAGLTASGLPLTDVCGPGNGTLVGSAGDTMLTFSGATLAPGATCTFSVTLASSGTTPQGVHTNTAGPVTATVDGVAVTGLEAKDDLVVTNLTLSKEFTDDPVFAGNFVSLTFTIDNTAAAANATSISFSDDFEDTLDTTPGVAGGSLVLSATEQGLLPRAECGGTIDDNAAGTVLSLSGGTLAPATSCSFTVQLEVPAAASPGVHANRTTGFGASIDGAPFAPLPDATDDLVVDERSIMIVKEFIDDPVGPGGTATLRFTLTNDTLSESATALTFTDVLDASLAGLTATAPLPTDPCGAGSSISGTTTLTLMDGVLAKSGDPGDSCTFDVTVAVPAGAPSGSFTNTTSALTGFVGRSKASGAAASDDLVVTAVTFTKSFDGATTVNGTPVLSFTLTNRDTDNAQSGLTFTDDLNAVVAGLVATGLPTSNPCGAGSTIAGSSTLTLTGGELAKAGTPGDSCTFAVNLLVPADAAPGTFPNTTSEPRSNAGVVGTPATASLTVVPPPTFAKVFSPDSIGVGQTSTLTFTIDNTASVLDATGFGFVDTFPTGVVIATPPGASTTCSAGMGDAAAGNPSFTFGGGTVPAAASCIIQFDVTSAVAGSHVNTTDDLTSSSGNSGTATDTLVVNPQPGFAKVFAPDALTTTNTSTLTFTIDNSGSTVDATSLDFSDTLPTGVTIATPSGAATTCTGGTLTAPDGGSTISYSGGTVAAGSSCTVSVDVVVSTPGDHDNTSGALTSSLGSSGTASDTLTMTPRPPTFVKAFAPDTISVTTSSTLAFTIDNSASPINATGFAFTDAFPPGVVIATPPGAVNTCVGGMGDAAAGNTSFTFVGGTVPAGASCTISVDVVSTTPGSHVNTTGDLTSSSGNSGTATDTLTVVPPPTFAKAFAPDTIFLTTNSTLTFTIDNSASTLDATSLDFTDTFPVPAGFVLATPSNATTTCTGGTLTATDGGSTVTYTGGSVAAGATCTVTVDVTGILVGDHDNVSDNLTSSSGDSGTAADTLTVTAAQADISITKDDGVTEAVPGQDQIVYTIVVANAGPSTDPAVAVDDTFPTELVNCAWTSTASIGVVGNSSSAGTSLADTLFMPAGSSATYTVTCDIDPAATGTLSNTATATPSVADLDTADHTATDDDTLLTPVADLAITVVDDPDPVAAGENVEFAVEITNLGPSTAFNATSVISNNDPPFSIVGFSGLFAPALAPGETLTGTWTVAVDPAATPGVYTTKHTAVSDTPDPNPLNDEEVEETTVIAVADLSIAKIDDPDPVIAGEDLTYTLTVDNAGPSDAADVVVTDLVPAGTTFVSTSGCAEDPAGVPTCSLGVIPAGGSASYDITVTVDPSTTGTVVNEALVAELDAANEVPPAGSMGSGRAMVLADVASGELCFELRLLDLTGTVTGAHVHEAAAGVNGPVVVNLNWPTNGPSGCVPAAAGVLADILADPAGYYVNVHTDAFPGGEVRGQLDSGIAAGAIADSSTFDPNTTNNGASATTTVVAEADLVILKDDGGAPVTAGNSVTYAIDVTNVGPSDATNVTVIDTVPAGLMFDSATVPCTPGVPGPGQLTCDLGTIAAGSAAAFDVTFSIDPATPAGDVVNVVDVSSDVVDPDLLDNSAVDTTTIVTEADLSVTKTDLPDPVVAGETLTYTITVDNAGPSDAADVVVTDLVPAGTTFGSTSGCAEDPAGAPSCTLGSIAAGASVSYTITVTVDPATSGSVVNSSLVAGLSGANEVPAGSGDPLGSGTALVRANAAADDVCFALALSGLQGTVVAAHIHRGVSGVNGPVVVDLDWPSNGATGCVPADGALIDDIIADPGGFYVNVHSDVFPAGAVRGQLDSVVAAGAVVGSSTPDPDLSNNGASATTAVIGRADIAVTKTDGVDSAVPGGPAIVYTIVATNNGPSADPAVTLTDTFPAALDCSWTTTDGPTATGSGNLSETFPLAVGASVTYTVSCSIDAAATGTVTNTATVAGSFDPNAANDSATDTTALTPQADVSVTKTDGRTSAVPGRDLIAYTIVVSNAGPSQATGVSLTDAFPNALTCTWTSTASGGATGNSATGAGDLSETLTLPLGSSVTYTTSCSIDPAATGTLSNTVTASVPGALTRAGAGLLVARTFTDPNLANNTATDSDTVLRPVADISVTKTDGRDSATPGRDLLTYTIVVSSAGPSVDPAVKLVDDLPAFLACEWNALPSGGATVQPAAGTGDIESTLNMPPNSSVTIRTSCRVLETTSNVVVNTAIVAASVSDPTATNDRATDVTELLRPTGVLPATGGDGLGLVNIGVLFGIAGLMLLALARRRRRRTIAGAA